MNIKEIRVANRFKNQTVKRRSVFYAERKSVYKKIIQIV